MFCWEVGWRDWVERLDVYVIGVCVCECMHFCVCAFLCVCVHVCMHVMCVLVWVCNLHMDWVIMNYFGFICEFIEIKYALLNLHNSSI